MRGLNGANGGEVANRGMFARWRQHVTYVLDTGFGTGGAVALLQAAFAEGKVVQSSPYGQFCMAVSRALDASALPSTTFSSNLLAAAGGTLGLSHLRYWSQVVSFGN